MRCLALRHIACEDLAGFEAPLRERFDELEYIDMDAPGALGRLEEAASAELVVVLGGPMGVYEADRYPFIKREIEILGERLRAGRPTLGICLGAQIMAAAAGARVYPGGRQEVGWYPIVFTPEAASDPVWGRLVERAESGAGAAEEGSTAAEEGSTEGSDVFFHWHGDTFDLPEGARLLGGSERFERQGFTIGRHGVAMQFHIEITPAALGNWLDEYEAALKPGAGVMSGDELRAGAREYGAGLAARGRGFLEAWLDELF